MTLATVTLAERQALWRLYCRDRCGAPYFAVFCDRFRRDAVLGILIGTWSGMTVGIETDGTTHT